MNGFNRKSHSLQNFFLAWSFFCQSEYRCVLTLWSSTFEPCILDERPPLTFSLKDSDNLKPFGACSRPLTSSRFNVIDCSFWTMIVRVSNRPLLGPDSMIPMWSETITANNFDAFCWWQNFCWWHFSNDESPTLVSNLCVLFFIFLGF